MAADGYGYTSSGDVTSALCHANWVLELPLSAYDFPLAGQEGDVSIIGRYDPRVGDGPTAEVAR